MIIDIEDNLSFRSAWIKFKQEWVTYHMRNGMSIAELARRSKTTRKTIRDIIRAPASVKEIWKKAECIFCGAVDNIDEHHIDGKGKPNSTICLCERCHIIFHSINKRYKTPLNEQVDTK